MSSNGFNLEMDTNVIHISKAYSLEKLSFFYLYTDKFALRT